MTILTIFLLKIVFQSFWSEWVRTPERTLTKGLANFINAFIKSLSESPKEKASPSFLPVSCHHKDVGGAAGKGSPPFTSPPHGPSCDFLETNMHGQRIWLSFVFK